MFLCQTEGFLSRRHSLSAIRASVSMCSGRRACWRAILTMDRTTLTAALKPLQRRGLVRTIIDPADKRNRRVALTEAGRALLSRALPACREAHTRLEKRIGGAADRLRNDLRILAEPLTP